MRGLALIAMVGAVFAASPSDAQEIAQEKCWYSSSSFSPGSTFRASDKVMVCTKEFTWEPVEGGKSSGCIWEDKIFGPGAVAGGNHEIKVVCTEAGSWKRVSD
ncbi:hypothetical protein GCM10007927_04160 [Sulfitobacter pacificus]|uniref:DUF1496 domain-containing protein n=1 Tax=Sulfitobacter pacificus TaxID=1499314 RepID=A0ABQ5VFD5_9RHOB|nr:hypothetical protein GCM10007927_04160 [Sulfitobacter pacificus]